MSGDPLKVDPVEKDEPKREEALEKNDKGEDEEKEKIKILPEGELTEEEKALKEKLDHCVNILLGDPTIGEPFSPIEALEELKKEIQTSTSSLTAVPKPLKHLRPHYEKLKNYFKDNYGPVKDNKEKLFADILSVLSMVDLKETRDCLRYKLLGDSEEIGSWGHEYVRALAGAVTAEVQDEEGEDETKIDVEVFPPKPTKEQLEYVIDVLVPFQVERNLESDAIDMLFETNKLEKIVDKSNETNFERMALYLVRLADYTTDAVETEKVLRTAFDIYLKQEEYFQALRVALRFGSRDWVNDTFSAARTISDQTGKKKLMRKQMAALMASHRAFWYAEPLDSDLEKIISNSRLSDLYRRLARELNVEEAKTPEDVYKSHLSETGGIRREANTTQVESAKQNLASTFVNAFVNCGFIKDSLITVEGNSSFIFKNKEQGMLSATASLGMILLWDVDEGMAQIDKYLYSTDKNIKAGALLALGLVGCGVRDDCEPALGMLPQYLDSSNTPDERMCASLGLGLAYAGNPKTEISEALEAVVQDPSHFETSCIACLSLGFSFCGTGDGEVTTTLIDKLQSLPDADLDKSSTRFIVLGLALLFLGKQEGADAVLELIATISHPISKFAKMLISGCAYAGSGNVLIVQKFLHACAGGGKRQDETSPTTTANTNPATPATPQDGGDSQQPDRNEIARQNIHQSAAVIGIALVTMGESIGRGMAERTYQHLLQYGDVAVRRAVPLALALSYASNPDFNIIDVLSRLTHDADIETAMCAIMALGICGSGTNNSRIAGLLRLLASFYSKETSPLFVVRLAQGLLHAGKGLVTLSPYHSDRSLMLQPSICGLLAILICSLDLKSSLLGKLHFLMFALAPAVRPRMVVCVDENLTPVQGVQIRVGTSVDVVGQAGKPKTITGFQTHTSPALLSVGDRAEFAEPERYYCAARVLEGIVLVEPAPEDNPAE